MHFQVATLLVAVLELCHETHLLASTDIVVFVVRIAGIIKMSLIHSHFPVLFIVVVCACATLLLVLLMESEILT